MADWDWDLSAVVRSCAAAAAAPSTPIAGPTASTNAGEEPNISDSLSALTFQEEEGIGGQSFPFGFSNLVEPLGSGFEELHQLYQPFLLLPDNRNPSFSGEIRVNPTSFPRRIAATPPYSPSVKQEQPPLQHGRQQQTLHVSHQYPPAPPAQPPQTPRTRKRKSQQKKNVCHVTADKLSSDLWAWRKYGQKPIKGSPYPRNYYRCSSLKGCAARKQVERSNTDPNIFIVTYTGEHVHPRPTHRNSLAGSTRNKFTGALQKAETTSHPEDQENKPASFSPTTPLTAPIDEDGMIGGGNLQVIEGATRSDSTEDKEIGEDMMISDYEADFDDEDLLIPNISNNMSDDIFTGFRELNSVMPSSSYVFGQCSGSGDNSSPGHRN